MHAERLTIGPAAKYLGKSVETLRRWELEGRLAPYGRNRRGQRLYTRDQLDQVIAGVPSKPGMIAKSETSVGGTTGWLEGPEDPRLRQLWNEARVYILKRATEPIPEREDSPWFDPERPWRYVWAPENTDRCAEACERRVRRYLFPGVSIGDLKRLVDRTVEAFVTEDIDLRLRAEMVAEGQDPDVY